MRYLARRALLSGMVCFAIAAQAQEAMTESSPAPVQNAESSLNTEQDVGTTIIGEEEAAIGLYLMPWSEEPMGDVDRPPRLLDEPLDPIDTAQYRRQAEWYRAQVSYRKLRLQHGNPIHRK
jgi:hypothetical protein